MQILINLIMLLVLSEIKKEIKKIDQRSKTILCTTLKCVINKAGNNATKLSDDYSSMVSEAKHEATKRKVLKILIPKQMLQGLPIALEQVEAGNNSENLLNEIRKIVHSL